MAKSENRTARHEEIQSFVAWTDLAGPELFCALLAQYIEFAGGGS